jgi:NAD(P)-dependent dehydrogenase (short-subunit alcohol dehydrogenase family)
MTVDLGSAVAVITGGGSGIGRATALRFARRGCRVVVADIDGDRAAEVANELGPFGLGVPCDVRDMDAIEKVRQLTLEHFGRVDIVMNNVGVLAVGPVEQIPLDAWQRVIDINLLGVVRSNLVFLPDFLERRSGHIINTASTAGLLPYGYDRLPYTTTKHALVGLSEALALYLAPHGIGVSCLCPAGVATNIVEQITFYGDVAAPRSPDLPIVSADEVAASVVEAIDTERFLVLTAPQVVEELKERAEDTDAYLRSRHAANRP